MLPSSRPAPMESTSSLTMSVSSTCTVATSRVGLPLTPLQQCAIGDTPPIIAMGAVHWQSLVCLFAWVGHTYVSVYEHMC